VAAKVEQVPAVQLVGLLVEHPVIQTAQLLEHQATKADTHPQKVKMAVQALVLQEIETAAAVEVELLMAQMAFQELLAVEVLALPILIQVQP
jgi:hypothetical protein